jgi:hypothetical protein
MGVLTQYQIDTFATTVSSQAFIRHESFIINAANNNEKGQKDALVEDREEQKPGFFSRRG